MHAFLIICAWSNSNGTIIIIINTQLKVFIRCKMETVYADIRAHRTHIYKWCLKASIELDICVGVGIFKPFRKLISTCSLLPEKKARFNALWQCKMQDISCKYMYSIATVSTHEINCCCTVHKHNMIFTHAQNYWRKSYNLYGVFFSHSTRCYMLHNTLWIM